MEAQLSMEKTYKIGIVADLSDNGSIHQETFISAIEDAFDCLFKGQRNVELVWENDYATFEGGQISAKKLIDQKVDCVVGHFSSSAAKGALPFYEKQNIPLLLPAATASLLTENFNNAFRICSNDNHLIEFISEYFSNIESENEVFIGHDNSVHGVSLSEKIYFKLKENPFVNLSDEISKNIFYVGSYKNSIHFLNEIEQKYSLPFNVCFSDDVLHPNLIKDLSTNTSAINIFGFDNPFSYINATDVLDLYAKKRNGKTPNTYYLETYSAMQIISCLVKVNNYISIEEMNTNTFNTAVGSIKFDKGESNIKHLAIWKLQEDNLITT